MSISDTSRLDPMKDELHGLLAAIAERQAAEEELEAHLSGKLDNSEIELRATLRSIDEQSGSDHAATQQAYETARNEVLTRSETDLNAARAEYQAILADIERDYTRESQAAEREKNDASWMVSSVLDDQSHESPRFQFEQLKKRLIATRDRIKDRRREMDDEVQAAAELMESRRQGQSFDEPEQVPVPRDLEACEQRFDSACETIRRGRAALARQKLPRVFGSVWPFVLFFLVGGLVFAPSWLLVDPAWLKIAAIQTPSSWAMAAGGGAAIISLVFLLILLGMARAKSGPIYQEIQQAYAELKTAHKRWTECAKKELPLRQKEFETRYAEIVAQRDRALANVETKAARQLGDAATRKQQDRAAADAKYPALFDQIARARDDQLRAIDGEFLPRLEGVASQAAQAASIARQQCAQVGVERRSNEKRARDAIAKKWLGATSQFQKAALDLDRECRLAAGDWSSMLADSWTLPDRVQSPLRLGSYDVDLSQVPGGLPQDQAIWPEPTRMPAPLVLPFPACGSLLFESQGPGRAVAVEAIRSVMLRLLTSFPPGKLRFTVVDPVGLGEEFSAFMHLADFDELLIGTRIWTERSQIEKKLTDLSEHMENVFQAYLRNEYESIEEYNIQAGEVAEPYQFLVVANFPANFTETAAQRLVSIATSGSRCGVYTLISVDSRQALPHGFDLADLESSALTFDWKGGQFVARDPDLERFPARIEAPPKAADFSEIVRSVGRQSKDSRRVEVAFERIAPKNGELWTLDSRRGLDVPLGRAGATKLQNLTLGRGTSQHVLIAGKTGSGKSSLLHSLITNLALYYSPNEVEFFLVDFKKGVEFKTYAAHALPHARIIGIESDREFGISVLERLDGILKERGELFRNHTVQDIASYRKVEPEARLPRILLVVDEFQEFFVEDDSISQTATLLLDRLVRQGRAFGIHVLLGSQSLGGAYSLARSTLGQVAVRIALQCSEGDAHLILSEENAAARLLTRPGEAIYNDSNGLTEGNHPFQVAWLPDETRERYLQILQNAASAKGIQGGPSIVFEGNLASDPRRNQALMQVIEAFGSASAAGSARQRPAPMLWLGEAVSIKPPTRITLDRRPGNNLMIVGQDVRSVQGMLAVAYFTLAAQQKLPETDNGSPPQFYILDGDATESDDDTEWKQTIGAVPHRVVRCGQREAEAVVEQLAAEVARRAENPDGSDNPSIFIFVSNLSKFRNLRNEEDDFGFGGSSDKPPSPGKQLSNVLRDGPAVGVHSFVWCDTYSNLNRWMNNQTLREIEIRVAFQMNSADSSNLIDSPAASKLGGHRALLYLRETGSIEKLRPYAVPSTDWLSWVADQFQKGRPDRGGQAADSA